MPDWDHLATALKEYRWLFGWVAVASGVLFVGCLAVIPWLAAKIPVDYFVSRTRPPSPLADRHPLLRLILFVLKNLLGLILVLFGILMLVLPGQGILTIVMGILLLNFPGKHALERRMVRSKPIFRSINWLRERRGVPPILVEPAGQSADASPPL